MNQTPFATEWLTLLSLLREDELLRLRKRAEIKLTDGQERYLLTEALTNELLERDLIQQMSRPE